MKIVVLDGYTMNPGDNPWSPLEEFGEVRVFDRSAADEVLPRAMDAEVIVTNKVVLNRERLDALPRLQFITVTATGVNVVDLEAARERGVPVSNVPEYGSRTVAQFVMAQLLHLCHRVQRHDGFIREGQWAKRQDFSFWESPQRELVGKTLGVVGFGRIGQEVGRLAHAFGMKVLAATGTGRPSVEYSPFEYVSLEQLAHSSDVVSLHCPLTDANHQMVNTRFLTSMKPSAFLINTARGGLVHERDLSAALEQGLIAGAALDVVSTEPIDAQNPLLNAPNCLLTPHMAWAALESRTRLMQATAENIRSFLAGTPTNMVNS